MTFFLGDQQQAGGAPLERAPTTPGQAFSAAAKAERIRLDSLGNRVKAQQSYYDELLESLGDRVKPAAEASYFQMPLSTKLETIFDQLGTMDGQEGPTPLAGLPRSREDFDTEIDRRLRAQLDEAQNVLGFQPEGSWVSELAGNFWAGATDEATLVTLPFGASTGAPLWKILATEFALGVGSEAMMLPRQFETAERLDLPEPEILKQLAFAGVTSGVLGGGIAGTLRFGKYLKNRRAIGREGRPDGVNEFAHEAAISDAETQMDNDAPVRSPVEIKYPTFGDFDFGVSGNASPKTNRIGYVYGKLLELGYEPHIAAGLTGNLMQESTVRLATGIKGDGGQSIGIAQWNKARARSLEEFARKRGKDWRDLDTQIAFLDHELKGSEAPAWEKIKLAQNPRDAALIASQEFWRPSQPHNSRRMSYAESIGRQFENGTVPKWERAVSSPADDAPTFTTSRPFTTDGTVTAGNDFRVGVQYEVVDASILRQARGRFQPRDRSRASSDEFVSETAAALDPARLMPSPEADRGAPIVGGDNMIESGNGRVLAIKRAYERHPDRADAYRAEIEAAGYPIPEGVNQPILVARRTSELDDAGRQKFIREANTSSVARMSATERSAADAASLDGDILSLFQAGHNLRAPENRAFVSRVLAALPQAERNGLVDRTGALNSDGVRRIGQAMFARAYSAPDIIARYAETDAGELRSLLSALEQAAPEWAAMRAAVAAGELRPDADITPFILDAMRLIGNARDLAGREGINLSGAIDDLLNDVDLLEGTLSPLTIALVGKFWRKGRAAPADKIADFLRRYATEAQKVARADAGLLGEAPGPVQILRAVDKKAFGDLPDDLGQPRQSDAPALDTSAMPEEAFSDGANSPETIVADAASIEDLKTVVADEPFGPVHTDLRNQPKAAIERLMAEKEGEVPDAVVHPDLGEIALVYGGKNFGLLHIASKHGSDILDRVPEILTKGKVVKKLADRAYIQLPDDPPSSAIIRLDWDGAQKHWLATAFEDERGMIARQVQTSDEPPASVSSRIPDTTGRGTNSAEPAENQGLSTSQIANLRAEFGEIELEMPDGTTLRASELLDDIEGDTDLADIINLCSTGKGS